MKSIYKTFIDEEYRSKIKSFMYTINSIPGPGIINNPLKRVSPTEFSRLHFHRY